MKITVNKQNLHHIVNVVATIIPTRAAIPALTAVFLAMKDGLLTAAATDITTFAVAHCKAEGEDCAFGVPASLLLSRLSTFTGEDVEIEVDQRATFKCGSARATLSIIPSSEFPPTNDVIGPCFTINAQELHDCLAKVLPSSAEDEKALAFPTLQSVLFEFIDGRLTMFATDGIQASFITLPVSGGGHYLVPRKFVGYMLKLLDGCKGDVSITFSENQISVEAEYWAISGVLLAGQYPQWRGKIPQHGDPVLIDREELSDALRACLPFGENGFTRIEIEAVNDSIRLNSGVGNECYEEITATCEPFKLAIEGRRLLSLLGALKAPLVTLEIQNTEPHIVVMREENFTGVINPLR